MQVMLLYHYLQLLELSLVQMTLVVAVRLELLEDLEEEGRHPLEPLVAAEPLELVEPLVVGELEELQPSSVEEVEHNSSGADQVEEVLDLHKHLVVDLVVVELGLHKLLVVDQVEEVLGWRRHLVVDQQAVEYYSLEEDLVPLVLRMILLVLLVVQVVQARSSVPSLVSVIMAEVVLVLVLGQLELELELVELVQLEPELVELGPNYTRKAKEEPLEPRKTLELVLAPLSYYYCHYSMK